MMVRFQKAGLVLVAWVALAGSTQIAHAQYFHAKLTVEGTVTFASDSNAQAAAAVDELVTLELRDLDGNLVKDLTITVVGGDGPDVTAGKFRAALRAVLLGVPSITAGGRGEFVSVLRNLLDFKIRICEGSSFCAPIHEIPSPDPVFNQTYLIDNKMVSLVSKLTVEGIADDGAADAGILDVTVEIFPSFGPSSQATVVIGFLFDAVQTAEALRDELLKDPDLAVSGAGDSFFVVTEPGNLVQYRVCVGSSPCVPATSNIPPPRLVRSQLYMRKISVIPTVSQWGLLLLALLVLVGGTIVLRRRLSPSVL